MGFSNTTLEMNSGQIQFTDDGSAIDLNAIYQLSLSDTSGSRIINGSGWVSSFFYQYVKPNMFTISCSIEDFGQIKWLNTSLSEQKNVRIHFEGFQISDIIHVDNDAITHTKDSLINSIYYPSKVQSYYTQTPCRIGIDGSVHLSKTSRFIGLGLEICKYQPADWNPVETGDHQPDSHAGHCPVRDPQ